MNFDLARLLLRLGPSVVMMAFGSHQMYSPQPWIKEYMPKWIKNLYDPDITMRIHGTGNAILGLLLLFGIGEWWSLIWWLSILPFAFYGSWKAGLRDLAIVLSLVALILLTTD
jgi:hypothetical protein